MVVEKHIGLIGVIAIVIFYSPVLLLTEDALLWLTEEDGLYESLGALFFLFGSTVFLITFLKASKRNIFFLLFAFAFFFAAGEEISWGQRLLHFDTPPAVEAINDQGEFTFHNLSLVQHEDGIGSSIKGLLWNFNRLFILFWIVYCILIPLAHRYSTRSRSLFSRVRLPIISIWFGTLFLLNEITGRMLQSVVIVWQDNCPRIYEIKESMWAFLAFLMALYFFSFVMFPGEDRCSV